MLISELLWTKMDNVWDECVYGKYKLYKRTDPPYPLYEGIYTYHAYVGKMYQTEKVYRTNCPLEFQCWLAEHKPHDAQRP